MDQSFHLALTGHRPGKLAGYNLKAPFYTRLRAWLDDALADALASHDHVTCHTGMALGADTVWAQTILAARQAHPGRVALVCEVPTPGQPDVWPVRADRDFWRSTVLAADLVNVYSEEYSPRVMQLRNEGMIDTCDLLLAVHDGSSGGTANALRYARRKGKPVVVVDPSTFR